MKMRNGEGTTMGDMVAGMDEQAKLERVYAYPFGDIYNNYLAKVQRKGHSRDDLDDVLGWFTGLGPTELAAAADSDKTLREFFDGIDLNPNADLITGKVCGVRVEEVEDELMRKIRQMDLIVDEFARGKKISSIKRG
ncbi:DUF2200 family protein [Corynebacterium fournieri]|uniref:DUF2200 family protein n=1 Tax=Corynebacterium fournieri TaxID=1852390 RepID=UPI003F49425B